MTAVKQVLLLYLLTHWQIVMADSEILIIDDRSSDSVIASSGNAWSLVTDDVMGGVSQGRLSIGKRAGVPCLHMQGEVSLDNNGGFVQMTLNLSDRVLQNVSDYDGLLLEVSGNSEEYNVHLRTEDIWLPWQSYRTSFITTREWQQLYIPFAGFAPHRINQPLNTARLKRIGLVAIGRAFNADLCLARIALYRE